MADAQQDARVPTALDFPDCRACQMWKAAGAGWPRPCKQHYDGEPEPDCPAINGGPCWCGEPRHGM